VKGAGRYAVHLAMEAAGFSVALLGLRLFRPQLAGEIGAAGLGVAVMLAIAVLGFSVVAWGRSRSQQAFMVAVFGAMGVKMLFVALAVVAVVGFTSVPSPGFIAGLFVAWVATSASLIAVLEGERRREVRGGGQGEQG